MNDFEFKTPTQHESLPVVAQLGVLLFILGGLFGSLVYLQGANANTQPAAVAQPNNTNIQPLPPAAPTPRNVSDVTIQGAAAYVWDVREERALYKKNAEEVLPLASITKLMTTLLTYELFAPEEHTTLPLAAIWQSGDMGLVAGEEFRAGDLQNLALISSSNDAAYALGASVGSALGDRDPTAQFVTGMNIRAEELGLSTLDFKNTTGLDVSVSEAGATGSAKDVTFLMEYIIENHPDLLAATTQSNTRVYNTDGAYHEVFNTNELVGDIPNLLGSKTGYTDLAGGNLTVAFDAGLNRPIIITVLGSTRNGRFNDVATLLAAVQETFASEE